MTHERKQRVALGFGVDGCLGGWIGAAVSAGRLVGLYLASEFAALVDALGALGKAASTPLLVDMPMGLPDRGQRQLEQQLRELLPARRKSSVFGVPCRSVLGATSHGEASTQQRLACGHGLSIQSYGLLPKIAELDRYLRSAPPAVAAQCYESHPELAFARFAGETLLPPKRTAAGRAARRRLLVELGLQGVDAHTDVRHGEVAVVPVLANVTVRRPRCAEDDALDAIALAMLASRPRDWYWVVDPLLAHDRCGVPFRVIVPKQTMRSDGSRVR